MTYIIILVIFLVVVFFIQKAQKSSYSALGAAVQAADPMKELAAALGLTYQSFSPGTNANTLYSSGSRVTGTYNGVPVELIYALSTQSESALSGYVASYTMQKTITFGVSNNGAKQFDILPKQIAPEGGSPTGNALFDDQYRLIGNISLSPSFLQSCVDMGYMHLSLKEKYLTFYDSFYDQFKGASGSMQMMNAVHPLWKSTAQNPTIDIANAKKFFDSMTEFAKTL